MDKNRLVLFDIDQTMIDRVPAHTKAFTLAFKEVYGVDTTVEVLKHHGMTDQQIIIETLKIAGLDEKTILSKIQEYMNVAVRHFDCEIKDEDVKALPGVHDVVKALAEDGALLGLVTGNLEPIGMAKLRKIGLEQYFSIGGFGSDHIERAELVRLAIKRAEQKFGFKRNHNVFLIGDTPRDIDAGKKAGVITIGVATGIYSREALLSCGADFSVDNLKDPGNIIGIINRLHPLSQSSRLDNPEL